MVEVAYKPLMAFTKKLDTPAIDVTVRNRWNRYISFTSATHPIFTETFVGQTLYVDSIFLSVPAIADRIIIYGGVPYDFQAFWFDCQSNSHLQLVFPTPLELIDGIYITWSVVGGSTPCYMNLMGFLHYKPTKI